MSRTVLQVFLSSTAADLKPHREAITARLARIEFIKCIRQEDFGAQSAETVPFCCTKAAGADLFIGLIGMRRGFEPPGDNAKRSITEMEYDAAKGRRRLLWLSPDDFPVPGNLRESATEHRRQLAFRKRVSGEQIVSQRGFASPDALASEIVEQLLAHIVTSDLIERLRAGATGSATAPVEDQTPAVAAAVEKLAGDDDIDLLAVARDPKGVDIAELERKLTARAEQHEADSRQARQTGAEYWRHLGALAFLQNTAKAIAAYEKAVALDPNNADGWRYLGELQFRRGDLAGAEKSFAALVEHGRRTSDKRAQSNGCLRLGWIYRNEGDLARAEAMTIEALELARGWSEGSARAYGNLGNIHGRRRDLTKAEEMHRKALSLNEELGSKEGMARDYTNLGNIHSMRGDLTKAEEMHCKALALNEDLGRKEGMARAYGNLGIIHSARNDLGQAEEMHRKALALDEELGRKEGMAVDYANLGSIHGTRGDLAKAEEMLRKALALNEELSSKEGMARAYWNLGCVCRDSSQKTMMCQWWGQARDIWRDMDLDDRAAEVEKSMKLNGCPDV